MLISIVDANVTPCVVISGARNVFSGEVEGAVKAAVDAVKGNPPCEIIAAAVISAPSEETSRLVKEEEEKHHK